MADGNGVAAGTTCDGGRGERGRRAVAQLIVPEKSLVGAVIALASVKVALMLVAVVPSTARRY